MSGWIKLYRTILENPVICKDAEHFAVWSYLLLKATHTEMEVIFAGKKMTLQPGQLITGRKQIAEHFKIAESKVQRILKKLESEQQIEQQTSNKNRLISIVNWNVYQKSEQQTEQQVNNKCTPSEQQIAAASEQGPIEEKQVAKEAAFNQQEIIDAWNTLDLTQIKKLAGKRLAATKARIKEYNKEEFIKAMRSISESSFLMGDNDKGWTITYDWFVAPSNFVKVLEGNYIKRIVPKLNVAASNMPPRVQMQNAMDEHKDLLSDIDRLEQMYIDNKIKEMEKAQ